MPVTPTAPLIRADKFITVLVDCDCWFWIGALDKNGRGRFGSGTKAVGTKFAYRIIYEAVHGPIPNGLVLDHLCNNPQCVNPRHLMATTHQINDQRAKFKDKCSHGHALVGHNLYIEYSNKRAPARRCRICRIAHSVLWKQQHRKHCNG